ncbi:DUF86 domain-containing protein [Actinomyces bowdenii]|uniref:HepT-like ribonuclease domain-containing protein n=1 Tax=Actinomyces bowdenii TaxID=131109 RepID=UPI001ABCF94D|nr:DUF86 domain-containing protein [Actinomyces bowdenii]
MTPTSRTPDELLQEALFHCERAMSYAQRDLSDMMALDAVALRIVAGIDAIGALPEGLRSEVAGGDWPVIRGMRNRIVHGYVAVDSEVLATTAQEDVPVLVHALRDAIERRGAGQRMDGAADTHA